MMGVFFIGITGVFSLFFFDITFLKQPELIPMYLALGAICIGFCTFCQLDRIPIKGTLQKFTAPIQDMSAFARKMFVPLNASFIFTGFVLTFFLCLPVYLFAQKLYFFYIYESSNPIKD
jgi:hypothetical protein